MDEIDAPTKAFLDDLKAVCKKHDVVLSEDDICGEDGQHYGTEYLFKGGPFDEKTKAYHVWVDIEDVCEYLKSE